MSSFLAVNSSVLHIFRRVLHLVETGSHTTEWWWWSRARTASGMVRLQKDWSFFWRTSFAMAAEVTTTVVTQPSLRLITGPWILARSAMDSCGLFPRLSRFPMIGNGRGPGGGSLPVLDLLLLVAETTKM